MAGEDARRNFNYVLKFRDSMTPHDFAAAEEALARIKERTGEDTDSWADNLASDLSEWTD